MPKAMQYSKQSWAGFTLLELLVVVAIIGFLSSVSIVALSASKAKSRDTQRKLDQITIIKAAELYTNDFGVPPSQLCNDANPNNATPCDSNVGAYLPERQSRDPFFLGSLLLPKPALAAFGPGGGGGPPPGGCQILTCQPGWVFDPSQPPCGVCVPGGGAVCGNAVCDAGEDSGSCVADCHCGDNICQAQYDEAATCPLDCGCNENSVCEGTRGENISSCSDCSVGAPGGGTPATCDNAQCDTGETPGNCSQDCTDYSICYVGGEWNLCCLFGGNYCTGSGSQTSGGGYYGVCNNDRCEQKYLLQQPVFRCSTNADCAPGVSVGVTLPEEKFVAHAHANWLSGLEPYVVTLPKDPGGHADPKYDIYYASSHPDIVGRHRFCVWVSLERTSDNFNPYNDLSETPTGAGDLLYWTPLCVQ